MPSCARKYQLTGSLLYHIYSRSASGREIFRLPQDYAHFARLASRYTELFHAKLYHWAIMPNHYHLLLEIEQPEQISSMMAGISRAYTHYHHKVYETFGFLWQGRFKMQPVEKESYIFACARYIERNPVRAKMVSCAEQYPYSSAAFYCTGRPDAVTCEDPMFHEFGADARSRQAAYKKYLREFDYEEEKYYSRLSDPVGGAKFINLLRKEGGRPVSYRRGRAPVRNRRKVIQLGKT
ncbi:MAG: transposase [Candidatus Omnitrophica bacterium]|jgi:putative transposase|nr:transposase [Candidatus Omnitrophota bacterium]